MSASEIQAYADINLDEFERQLRAPEADLANAGDKLAGAVRLIKSGLAPQRSPSLSDSVSKPAETGSELARPLETPAQSTESTPDEQGGLVFVDAQAPQAPVFAYSDLHGTNPSDLSTKRARWMASALAVAGAAIAGATLIVGAAFWHGGEQPAKAARIDVADRAPNAQPVNEIVAASRNVGGIPREEISQPAEVKAVTPDEQPIDANARASLANALKSAALASTRGVTAQPTTVAPAGPVAESASAPAALVAAPSPATQSPEPAAPSSLAQSATPTATAAGAAADLRDTAHASDAPQPPKLTPKAESEAAVAQPSTHKLDLPGKPADKPSPRALASKTDAAAPDAAPEIRTKPLHLEASLKPEKAARAPKAQVEPQIAQVEPQASSAEPQAAAASPAPQPFNPLAPTLNFLAGAMGRSPPQSDPSDASQSSGWSVQFAAPKSEAQAKTYVARLNAKYAPALNGAKIGVQKTLVNGETLYALRIAGLSKADAAALCLRLKGRDCSTAQ